LGGVVETGAHRRQEVGAEGLRALMRMAAGVVVRFLLGIPWCGAIMMRWSDTGARRCASPLGNDKRR